jgi:hypothetical protein
METPMSKKSKDTSAVDDPVYDPEPVPEQVTQEHEPVAQEPSLAGKKLAAVTAAIKRLAEGSGADVHFTEAGVQQWASRVLEAIEMIENPPPPPVVEPPVHAEEHAYEEESAR